MTNTSTRGRTNTSKSLEAWRHNHRILTYFWAKGSLVHVRFSGLCVWIFPTCVRGFVALPIYPFIRSFLLSSIPLSIHSSIQAPIYPCF